MTEPSKEALIAQSLPEDTSLADAADIAAADLRGSAGVMRGEKIAGIGPWVPDDMERAAGLLNKMAEKLRALSPAPKA